ncbi:MAG: reductive dehalogenase [Deltaproteobacteria bacterium]|nr:reductive dehalogenase [Deltaproteobacteria bacterium]
MFENSIKNIGKQIQGKTILDHAMGAAARTPDSIFRKTTYARDEAPPAMNRIFRLRDPEPYAMTRVIKDMAIWSGADQVGVARLNPLWLYTNWGLHNIMYTNAAEAGDPIEIPAEYTNVIVMIHEMDYDLIKRSPYREAASPMGYSRMAWCASILASFIRELGYKAIPCGNELGLSIPMAVDAGLGEMGPNGLLITRDFGPRVRISKVLTELPLVPDSPIDMGVQEFCEKCKLCAKYCPSRALMSGERTDQAWDQCNSPGMLKWPIRAMRCFEWWVKNGNGCSVCIRVCPWNKPNNSLHKIVRIFAERNLLIRLIVKLDQLLGFGRQSKRPLFAAMKNIPPVEKLPSSGT